MVGFDEAEGLHLNERSLHRIPIRICNLAGYDRLDMMDGSVYGRFGNSRMAAPNQTEEEGKQVG